MGTISRNNRGFRNQTLAPAGGRSRYYDALAAKQEIENQRASGPQSIIGGQTFNAEDLAGKNAALAGVRDAEAFAKAARETIPTFGSQTVTRGEAGGLANPVNNLGQPGQAAAQKSLRTAGGPLAAPLQAAGGPALNNDSVYPGGPSFESLVSPTRKATPDIIGSTSTSGTSPLRSSGNAYRSDTSDFEYELDEGFRNGGMVNKQKSVKQPGYQSGGKIKMPERPRTDVQMEQDRMAAEMAMDEGMRRGAAQFTPKNPDDAARFQMQLEAAKKAGYYFGEGDEYGAVDRYMYDQNAPQRAAEEQANPRGYMGGGAVCKRKGMRGYATGGQIGDEMQDDGRDTVDVRVREGEYMLNPETVAAFGAGDYEAGASVLDGIVTATTGQEPGPTPVNEAGEPVQQGMRNGGGVKMGYAAGAGVQFDMFGEPVNQQYRFKPSGYQAPDAPKYGRMDTRFHGPQPQPQATAAAPKSVSGLRQALSGRHTTTVGDVLKGTGRAAKTAVQKVGGGAGMLRAAAPIAGISGAWQGFNTPTEDYAARMGIDYPETTLGEVGVRTAGVLSDVGTAMVDPFIELGNLATGLDVPTLRGEFADVQNAGGTGASVPAQMLGAAATSPEQQAAAAAQAPPPPDPYGRAFGAGEVDLGAAQARGLRPASEAVAPGGMNIVQNTGGPNGEVIVREDVNGVPTFTNLRQGGFDGSTRTLQAEADARVAQDAGIRQMQEQVVQQMRDSAPIYDQAGVDQRRQEDLSMQQAAMKAAGRGTAAKPLDLRKELEQQFQIPKVNEDTGAIEGYTYDQDKIQEFESVITKLNPEIAAQYGAPFHELPLELRQQVYTQIDPVLRDTIAAKRAQKNQGYPTSDLPRTGRNSLRALEGSDISFLGDAVFGDATLGEYFAGVGDGQGTVNDTMVTDPLSDNQTRIPLQRLMRGQKDEQEALRRYGYIK